MSRSDMDQPRKHVLGVESKIFDPRDASTGSSGAELPPLRNAESDGGGI
jgi:hypothetical protein